MRLVPRHSGDLNRKAGHFLCLDPRRLIDRRHDHGRLVGDQDRCRSILAGHNDVVQAASCEPGKVVASAEYDTVRVSLLEQRADLGQAALDL